MIPGLRRMSPSAQRRRSCRSSFSSLARFCEMKKQRKGFVNVRTDRQQLPAVRPDPRPTQAGNISASDGREIIACCPSEEDDENRLGICAGFLPVVGGNLPVMQSCPIGSLFLKQYGTFLPSTSMTFTAI